MNLNKEKAFRYLQSGALGALMLALSIFVSWRIFGFGSLFIASMVVGAVMLLSARRPPFIRGSVPLDRANAPELAGLSAYLARRAGLQRDPRIYLLPTSISNALTLGNRKNADIVITQGLLDRLSSRETAGVLAHEMSHIKNGDLAIIRFSEAVKRVTLFTSRFGWFLLLFSLPVALFTGQALSLTTLLLLMAAPALSLFLQMALLRTREFQADLGAAELTGDPKGLASALYKIERAGWFYHFLPLPQQRLQTHPPTDERIRRLLALAGETTVRPLGFSHLG